jgi:Transposase DDE domain group 1
MAGGTKPSPPAPKPDSSRSWRPGTALTLELKTTSAAPRTPAWAASLREFAINSAWAQLAAIAADLTTWLRLLTLGAVLAIAEPKKLRYRLLHIPGQLVRSGRRRRLRLSDHWPWITQLHTALTKINVLPALP